MADQNKEQIQTAAQILVNAASQARLTSAEHDQVRQAGQIIATELGLVEGQAPEIQTPEPIEVVEG
jgi:hypothetical protein